MNYLLLIQEPRGQRAARTRQEGEDAYVSMLAYAESLQREGRLLAMDSLLGDERGARVQVRDGAARAVDGPFTEAKEMIGGFFLVDCGSLAEAVALAERCPAAGWATVEVRPSGPCYG